MAEPTTISQVLPAPILEGALTAFTKKLEPLIKANPSRAFKPGILIPANFMAF